MKGTSPVNNRGRRLSILAAVVVGTVLLALVLPVLKRARGGRGYFEAKCMNNLKIIGLGLQMYANDNENWLPPDLYTLIDTEYLANDTYCFQCRARKEEFPSRFTSRGDFVCDYWYRGSGRLHGEGGSADVIAMDFADSHSRGWGAVLFSDGHVEYRKGKEWYRDVGDGQPRFKPE